MEVEAQALDEGPSTSCISPSRYFTRSKILQATDGGWKAAGVLPFSFHEGSCWVLLGGELARTGPGGKFLQLLFRDFGGLREAIDEDSAATASRECSEETLGMLFGSSSADERAVAQSTQVLARHLRCSSESVCVQHRLKKGAYHMYVCRSAFVDPLMFVLATEQNAARGEASKVQGAEKTLFAWVLLADVLKAVSRARKSYFLRSQPHRRIVARGQRLVPKKIPLHPCFASSLRIALDSGLLLPLVKACDPERSQLMSAPAMAAVAAPAAAAPVAAVLSQRSSQQQQEAEPAPCVGQPSSSSAGPAAVVACSLATSQDPSARPAGLLPQHMWWTLLRHDVATQLEIEVPPGAACFAQLVQGTQTQGPEEPVAGEEGS